MSRTIRVLIAAGPTTSIREEPYQWKIIKDYGVKAIIGKGGMGEKTKQACKKYGCLYLHAVGGAGSLIAKNVKKINNVYKLKEFGMPEAIWEIEVMDLKTIVTIDAKGNSLHDQVSQKVKKRIGKEKNQATAPLLI